MIRYRTLFQVDIAHDFFLSRGDVVFEAQPPADQSALSALYSIGSFLDIFPDEATLARLAGHRMLFRTNARGFSVAVSLDASASDLRPAIPPATDFKLTFALRLKDARFANYTELGPATTGFYRFGNDSQNSVAGVSFLSRRIAAFDASRGYVAGETYSEAADQTFNLFVALRDTGPAAAPVAADWRRIPLDTWNSAATYQTGAIVLSGNRLFRALVNGPGTDLNNTTDWQPAGVLGNQYATVADAMLPISPAALAQGWFGVIEIVRGTGDFALFNEDGTLRAPRYALRFLNRATRWRYIFPAVQAVGTGAEVAPEAGDAHILVTGSARALTRFGAGSRLQATVPATTTEEVLLPLPDVNLVRRQNAEWYSETRAPNITLGP